MAFTEPTKKEIIQQKIERQIEQDLELIRHLMRNEGYGTTNFAALSAKLEAKTEEYKKFIRGENEN